MPKKSAPGAGRTCRFCGIIAGTEPGFVVFRDELSVAFLDYRPLALGHVLLVPAVHYATLEALPDEAAAALATRIKQLSAAVITAMQADGSFVALNNRISQSVPHVHFHIVPRKKGDGLFAHRMIWKRVAYRDDAHRAETANRIRDALQTNFNPPQGQR
ncbi:MAG TPA: HIT family protein [Micropepsaceae bacterium]|nr:HIT family protein [Micropepsaceae bacterium]